jgi:hypothetical protein
MLTFKQLGPPPAVNRGLCPSCEEPVAADLRPLPLMGLALVPSRNFADSTHLPPPQAHIYYDTRVEDAVDDLPKASGRQDSRKLFGKLLLRSVLPI